MKFKNKSLLIFLMFGLIIIMILLSFIFYISYNNNKILMEEYDDYIKYVTRSSARQVNLFLEIKKQRSIDFSSDGFIKNSLYSLNNNNTVEEMNKLSRHLIDNKIVVDDTLYAVSVIDIFGNLVGTTSNLEIYGKNMKNDPLFFNGKNGVYVSKFFYDEDFLRYGIIVSSPVIRKGLFVGVVIVRYAAKNLTYILPSNLTSKKSFNIYMIDKTHTMITSYNYFFEESGGAFVQNIETENSKNCFNEKNQLPYNDDMRIKLFLDFKGNLVFGTYQKIPEVDWCLLVEIDKDNLFNSTMFKK